MNRLLLLVTAATASAPLFAQPTPPAVIQITREVIKEGRSAPHEKVEMDYARAFRKANFPFHYVALETMSGPGEVWFLSAYPSFAAVQKGDAETRKPAMKGELDLLDARDGELRSSSRIMYAVLRKDLSVHIEKISMAKTRYMSIGSYRVRLGGMGKFLEGAKSIIAASEKSSGMPTIAYQVVTGAPDGLFLFLTPMESLDTLDEMPARQKAIAEAMGPENLAKMMSGAGEVFNSIEQTLFAVNPKMSYVSKETEEADPAYWRPKMSARPADSKPKDVKAEKAGQ